MYQILKHMFKHFNQTSFTTYRTHVMFCKLSYYIKNYILSKQIELHLSKIQKQRRSDNNHQQWKA